MASGADGAPLGLSPSSTGRTGPSRGAPLTMRTVFFPPTHAGQSTTAKVQICNTSSLPLTATVRLLLPRSGDGEEGGDGRAPHPRAFHIKPSHARFTIQPLRFCLLPISFTPPRGDDLGGAGVSLSAQGHLTYNALLVVTAAQEEGEGRSESDGGKPMKLSIHAMLVGEAVSSGEGGGGAV